MTRAGMRFRCGALLLMPLVIVWVAPLVGSGRGGQQGPWLGLASVVFVALALFLFVAPFLVSLLLRGSREQVEALGIDVDQLTLLMGAAGSATVAVMALLFTMLFESSIAYPYPWVGLSFLGVAFWCWRLQRLLR